MATFISRNLLWLALSFSIGCFTLAFQQGWNLELAVLAATVVTLITAITIERWLPYRADWNQPLDDRATDLTSAAVLIAVIDPLLKLLGPLAVVGLYGAFGWQPGESPVAQLPLVVQILLASLLIEFGRYWSHRFHHVVPALWHLHAMHHSSRRLYTINVMRFHPLNYTLNFVIGALPVMLVGFSAEALISYLAISQPVLMLQHANIDLRSGWLNYLFSSNELHRWHHSRESALANTNFGNAIVLWDQMFGTFRYEPDARWPADHVGLFANSRGYPQSAGYLRQLCVSLGCQRSALE